MKKKNKSLFHVAQHVPLIAKQVGDYSKDALPSQRRKMCWKTCSRGSSWECTNLPATQAISVWILLSIQDLHTVELLRPNEMLRNCEMKCGHPGCVERSKLSQGTSLIFQYLRLWCLSTLLCKPKTLIWNNYTLMKRNSVTISWMSELLGLNDWPRVPGVNG